jgi:transcriptional regulator with XRE-family HTH domain
MHELKASYFKKIGELIKKERGKRKLTQEELADKAGISVVFLRKIEAGKSSPSIINMAKISKVLRKPVDYFIKHIESEEERTDRLWNENKKVIEEKMPDAVHPVKLDFKTKRIILKMLRILE